MPYRGIKNRHPVEIINVSIIKKTLRTTATDLVPAAITDEQDWRTPNIQKLAHPSTTMVSRDLKDFAVVNSELYRQGGGGVMAQALSMVEAKEVL